LSQDPVDEPDGLPTNGEDEVAPPEADVAPAVAPETAEGDATEQAHRRARLAEDRLTEVLAAYRQVKVENEGFRERVTRDVELSFDRRRERLLLKFIDILDNLDRALEAAEQTYAGNPLIEGLILVRTQLLQTLQQEGLERIPVLGLQYDPNLTEAVGTQPVTDPESDHVVVRELMRGYRLNGRVARASRAIVGVYKEDARPAELSNGEELIGADEAIDAAIARLMPGELDPAAETIPIDENTLREIFGEPRSKKKKPK
jgi:molecular chaperone GrpE